MTLRNKLFGLTLTSALALAAVSANAADIYVPGPGGYKDAPWAPEWAGFYIGANGGYFWSDASDDAHKFDGPIIGGQAGYNWQRGSFVFGIEADLEGVGNGTQSRNGGGLGAGPAINDYGSVVGRVGYSFGRALLYGRGGFAWGDTKLDSADFSSTGYTVGGGLAWKLAPKWSVFAEYDYVHLGSETAALDRGLPDTERFNFNVFKVGVNWHVGGWDYEPLK
jgi:outer membrane immunogenic protein